LGDEEQNDAAADTEQHVAERVLQSELRVSSESAVADELAKLPEDGRSASEREDEDNVSDAVERTEDPVRRSSEARAVEEISDHDSTEDVHWNVERWEVFVGVEAARSDYVDAEERNRRPSGPLDRVECPRGESLCCHVIGGTPDKL